MRAWNVDLVHAHDARSHALALIALLRRSDVPLVVTRRVAFTPRSVRLKYGSRVSRFIAISNAVKHAMTGAGIDPSRITVVHSGIQPKENVSPRDWRAELGWPAESIVCGIVGAMTGEKGTDLLEEIGAAIPAVTRERMRIVMLGGDRSKSPDVEGLVVHSAGFIEEIDAAVAGLDILLHPSRTEGLGTSVIDAMALGVPPVAFAVGGIPEVIENDVSGMLVPGRDVEAFGKSVTRLANDSELRHRLGSAGREKARQFDAAQMTQQTQAVYNELISG
jgi:glycosyltransferase involved in cell wall biosynthesis